MIEPNQLGAKEAARRIERGELDAQALIQSCLERIAARDAEVRAWVFVEKNPPIPLDTAPLRGIPVGVKDIFDTADIPTLHGSTLYAGHLPRSDAAQVALSRKAGGVILGKTVTAEFAT
ncbi:MAG: amidase family protein, partial [Burkholderiales bacterium]